LFRKPEGKRPLKDLGIDGKIILEWVLGKQGGKDWMHLAQDRDQWQALVNEPLDSMKGREILD
jgi:hypothetical protein